MQLTTLLTTFTGFVLTTSALAHPNPDLAATNCHTVTPTSTVTLTVTSTHKPTSAPSSAALVSIDIFTDTNCTGFDTPSRPLVIYDQECHALGDGALALKVAGVDKKLKYNSLRIYNTANCTNGWLLEPVYCGGQACGCSEVKDFRSIQVVLDE